MFLDLRVFERKGRLLLICAALYGPAGELELVPPAPQSFRAGPESWRADRLRFDALGDGVAKRVCFNQTPFSRTFTP